MACFSYIPSVEEYFAAYSTTLIVLLTICSISLLLVATLYTRVVKVVVTQYSKPGRIELILTNVIYVVVVVFSIISLAVPLFSEKLDLVSYIIFSWCIFTFYRYIRLAAGGHNALKETYELNIQSLATGNRLRRAIRKLFAKYITVRLSILQFPIVTTIISGTQIGFYSADEDLYHRTSASILPLHLISIILYLIAFALLIKNIESTFTDLQIKQKFRLLRLVVLVLRIQVSILEIIFRNVYINCDSFAGASRSIFNFVKQMLIVTEISILAIVTWKVYRREEKDFNDM
ncbi:uncharacterized protein LOC129729751 [Wyeomyia smithii]|uniref:uncharacterized protein LOC129729751 n=1 Tax=Wyeomyia smithii TaxID=174621 RepID=UPI0024682230|nr:uncharacterized protein LOC129729751 [Wyeomyia smithii]XP_055544544.1 uncharacterized protein LOC129729751 [Wyeomyia smithii]